MNQKQVKTNFRLELNGRPNSDGSFTILLRVSSQGKRFRVSTGIRLNDKHLKDFNPKAQSGEWITKGVNRLKLNEQLDDFITNQKTKVKKEREQIIDKQKVTHIGIFDIRKAVFKTIIPNEDSFLNFFEKQVEKAEIDKSVNYSKNLKSKLKKLKDYLQGKDLLFSEFTSDFLEEYRLHLIRSGNKPNTVISNLKDIRSVFYKKWKSPNYKGDNPFKSFEVGTMKSIKPKLDVNDLELIKNLDLISDSTIWHCRNYFMFSFYCAGIRVSDLIRLQWKNFIGNRLSYTMAKTGKVHSVILVPKAIEILDYYRPEIKKADKYIFPILNQRMIDADKFTLERQLSSKTAMINMNLKRIQKLADIDIKLSFHVSRHTFAGIAKDRKVSVYDIMNMLGHTKLSITETYLKQLGEQPSDESMLTALEGL